MSHNTGFKTILTAFLAGKAKTLKNDRSEINGCNLGKNFLTYHGNTIAWYEQSDPNTLFVTLAGWATVTTRARLNTILVTLGAKGGFYQAKHCQFAQGDGFDCEIDVNDILVIKEGSLAL